MRWASCDVRKRIIFWLWPNIFLTPLPTRIGLAHKLFRYEVCELWCEVSAKEAPCLVAHGAHTIQHHWWKLKLCLKMSKETNKLLKMTCQYKNCILRIFLSLLFFEFIQAEKYHLISVWYLQIVWRGCF